MQTVHKSKWAEADVCILLQIWKTKWKNKAKFPFLHPDYPFWKIFGDIPRSLLEEERRLFYVALTRTKDSLYFVSESEITSSKWISDFIISSFNEWCNSILQ
jgi:DNA helicase-4